MAHMEQYKGKITKGVGGNYEVHVEGHGFVVCRAKGILRYRRIQPLIGDDVLIETDASGAGNIIEILPRRNALVRPAIANVDQALLVCAIREPEFHPNLLDRFLILMSRQNMPVLVCFNKTDLAEEGEAERLCGIYKNCGAEVFVTQASRPETLAPLREALSGKTTVLAGPSGVGKSSLVNALAGEEIMETAGIREADSKGRHTTTRRQLIRLRSGVLVIDTPGMRELGMVEASEGLENTFADVEALMGKCRFSDCCHEREPGCAIRAAIAAGELDAARWESYRKLQSQAQSWEDMLRRKREWSKDPS